MFTFDESNIIAIANSDKDVGIYALYSNNQLFLADVRTQEMKLFAKLPNLYPVANGIGDSRLEGKELEINIEFHHPYICVFERFGLNAALVYLETGAVRELRREDYCCDVSSFSIGFIARDGQILLIHQTEWNRLDIIDVKTGENLTEREVWRRDSGLKHVLGYPIYEDKNYIDYFHSQLHVSPDYNHFLSNGWHWHPMGQIYLFKTAEFLRTFESGCLGTHCQTPYNWDRPCTFIDNETFVLALDNEEKSGYLDEEDLVDYEYFQLAFYKTDAEIYSNEHGHRWIEPFRKVKCSAFSLQSEGEVTGALFYDKNKGYLVGVTPDGAYAISMTGEIIATIPEAVFQSQLFSHEDKFQLGWAYSSEHSVLYSWQKGIGIVEKHF